MRLTKDMVWCAWFTLGLMALGGGIAVACVGVFRVGFICELIAATCFLVIVLRKEAGPL